jgi:hypothetical protein
MGLDKVTLNIPSAFFQAFSLHIDVTKSEAYINGTFQIETCI